MWRSIVRRPNPGVGDLSKDRGASASPFVALVQSFGRQSRQLVSAH